MKRSLKPLDLGAPLGLAHPALQKVVQLQCRIFRRSVGAFALGHCLRLELLVNHCLNTWVLCSKFTTEYLLLCFSWGTMKPFCPNHWTYLKQERCLNQDESHQKTFVLKTLLNIHFLLSCVPQLLNTQMQMSVPSVKGSTGNALTPPWWGPVWASPDPWSTLASTCFPRRQGPVPLGTESFSDTLGEVGAARGKARYDHPWWKKKRILLSATLALKTAKQRAAQDTECGSFKFKICKMQILTQSWRKWKYSLVPRVLLYFV